MPKTNNSSNKKSNVGILGLGEVGSAVKKLVSKKHKVFVRELKFDEFKDNHIEILHICIPFTNKFTSSVSAIIKETKPRLTIINSTVQPGTTQQLHKQTKANLVHAPIIGVHPNLYQYFFKINKPLGPVNHGSYLQAKKHFNNLGVKTEKFNSSLETELAKILSTTYYGWNILFEKFVNQVSKDLGADFKQVYARYNQLYNLGYSKDLPQVTRPVLNHTPGPIGGHCVIPNAKIVRSFLKDDFTAFLLKQNKKLAKENF